MSAVHAISVVHNIHALAGQPYIRSMTLMASMKISMQQML
jgi:hypothetical protein